MTVNVKEYHVSDTMFVYGFLSFHCSMKSICLLMELDKLFLLKLMSKIK